ncbi:MAG: hypothetical protein H5T76_30860 [Streptomyces sp.]|nr:hypothetical protein [Streptomyces sp.]NBM14190.1 hypothetical protein [Streptomyces sp. GC420]
MLLSERLMKVRTLGWYDKPLVEDLRAGRGVIVHTAPAGA